MDGLGEYEREKIQRVFSKLELYNSNQDETWKDRCEFEGVGERLHRMDSIISFELIRLIWKYLFV